MRPAPGKGPGRRGRTRCRSGCSAHPPRPLGLVRLHQAGGLGANPARLGQVGVVISGGWRIFHGDGAHADLGRSSQHGR